jgi:hypothetical protein
MWCGPISYGTSCFVWIVGFTCGTGPMRPWTPVVNKAPCRLVVVPYWCRLWSRGIGWMDWIYWSAWTRHWLVTTTLHCLVTICNASRTSCTSTTIGFSSRTMHHVFRPKLFIISSKSILEISDEWCGHHVRPTWTQLSIYGTWWRGPFTPEIVHLQILESYGQLSSQHGSTSLQRSSVDLLHFARLGTRYLSHDFWHLGVYLTFNLRVYN